MQIDVLFRCYFEFHIADFAENQNLPHFHSFNGILKLRLGGGGDLMN